MVLRSVLALAAVFAANVVPASASLIGDTVTFTTSVTGGTVITSTTGSAATVDGALAEFSACIGPNIGNCSSGGVSAITDFFDGGVRLVFFGGTEVATGTFDFVFSGFDRPILDVTPVDATLGLWPSFGLHAFTADTITFRGTVDDGSFIGTERQMTFLIEQAAAVPEPATGGLAIAAVLMGMSRLRRRRRP